MTLTKSKGMSIAQKNLLEYWARCEEENGKPPSIYQARVDLEYSSHSTVSRILQQLVAKGYMTKKQELGKAGNVYRVKADERTS